MTEEAFGGGGAVGAAAVVVVDHGQSGEFSVTEAVTAVMMEGESAVAALDAGTAALEQIGAVAGKRLELLAGGERQVLQRMRRLA